MDKTEIIKIIDAYEIDDKVWRIASWIRDLFPKEDKKYIDLYNLLYWMLGTWVFWAYQEAVNKAWWEYVYFYQWEWFVTNLQDDS